MSLYGGSKAAIRQFVRAWIPELHDTGIRINALSRGAADTPSLPSALADSVGAVYAKVEQMSEGTIPSAASRTRELGNAAVAA